MFEDNWNFLMYVKLIILCIGILDVFVIGWVVCVVMLFLKFWNVGYKIFVSR